jgi:hypothetical protein
MTIEPGVYESIFGNAVEVEQINEDEFFCFDLDSREEIDIEFVDTNKIIRLYNE